MNKISIFIFLLFVTKLLCCAAKDGDLWSTVVSGLNEISEERDARLESMVKCKVQDVERETQSSVVNLRAEALKKADKIKQNLKQEIKDVQTEAEQEIVEIASDSQQELEGVKQELDVQVTNVNKSALYEVIELIKDAEGTAFKIGQKKMERAVLEKLQKTFENPQKEAVAFKDLNGSLFLVPVPIYWKKQVAQNFYENSAKLEQIVLESESSDQATDFIKCFKDQREWFDKTLSTTNYTSDFGYSQIVRKSEMMDNIVLAVKKAENYLAGWADMLKFTEVEANKIRLLFLYEVNSQLMRLHDIPVSIKSFTDDQIRLLTLKIANDVTGRVVKAFPDIDFDSIQYLNVPKNMNIVSQIKEDISDLRLATDKKHFDLLVVRNFLKKLNSDLSDLSVQLYEDNRMKDELKSTVETLKTDVFKKDVATKKIKGVLLGKGREIKSLNAEIDQTKRLLAELKLRNDETIKKNEFIETMTELKLKEQLDVVKKKFSIAAASGDSDRVKQQESLNRQLIEKEILQRSGLK